MTDPDDSAPEQPVDASPAGEDSSVGRRLLALQAVDTQADQLRVKRERLAERTELDTRSEQLKTWERRRNQIAKRLDELTAAIEDAESRGATLGAHRARLEAQLKTVIAPREAEALMHEIDTVNAQRDELDDAELAALEEQAALDDERSAHLGSEPDLRAALSQADAALARVCAEIDAELEELAARRTEAIAALDPGVASRYASVRSALGVAVAQLKGHRCEGCHVDLSAAEVDTAKDDAALAGYADCPQCGRLIVI